MDLIIIRLVFIGVVAFACYQLQPFGLLERFHQPWIAGLIGAGMGVAVVAFERRLVRVVSLKRLIGAVIGSILGIFGAYLFSLVIRTSISTGSTQSFLQIMVMLLMSYVGLIVGANKGDLLNLAALGGIFGAEKQGRKSFKILDTSVIIDGRIADIAETGFLDGILVIPQFVLRELQLVADSADSLKRIVLPGETMKVFILKEGKEYNQGVAYLDDGTMVVVDNARKLIGKNVDIAVTSVLQTTAGKMIFGKYDERQRPVERVEGKLESAKHDLRKTQPIIVEPAPQTQPD